MVGERLSEDSGQLFSCSRKRIEGRECKNAA
jgi:hypothetical protein